jgi:hypothetical protein
MIDDRIILPKMILPSPLPAPGPRFKKIKNIPERRTKAE